MSRRPEIESVKQAENPPLRAGKAAQTVRLFFWRVVAAPAARRFSGCAWPAASVALTFGALAFGALAATVLAHEFLLEKVDEKMKLLRNGAIGTGARGRNLAKMIG